MNTKKRTVIQLWTKQLRWLKPRADSSPDSNIRFSLGKPTRLVDNGRTLKDGEFDVKLFKSLYVYIWTGRMVGRNI